MCGGKIRPGEQYYRENGKWEGDFFSRALHVQCHLMEQDYCCEVDNEFTWGGIKDYIYDVYCDGCEHSIRNEDMEGWTDCSWCVTNCPKIFKALCAKRKFGNETMNIIPGQV